MFDLNNNAKGRFVVFAISPDRMGEVTKLVNILPHKYVIGYYNDKFEASCVMPLDIFRIHECVLMMDQETYLYLGPARLDGTRRAELVSPRDLKTVELGNWHQVEGPPSGLDNAYTFDPTTGYFYTTKERA